MFKRGKVRPAPMTAGASESTSVTLEARAFGAMLRQRTMGEVDTRYPGRRSHYGGGGANALRNRLEAKDPRAVRRVELA
jgi:hypothetical protein